MIILNYSKEGKAVSDFDIIPLLERTLKMHNETNKLDMELNLSNFDVVNIFECAIRDGLLDKEDFRLVVDGLEIRLNQKGEELDNYETPRDEFFKIYVCGDKVSIN